MQRYQALCNFKKQRHASDPRVEVKESYLGALCGVYRMGMGELGGALLRL